MARKASIRVIYNKRKSRWEVMRNMSTVSTHDKKENAVERARVEADRYEEATLKIKNKDGSISAEHEY